METKEYPLSEEHRVVMIEALEEIGVENLHAALVRVLTHADCSALPVDQRETVYSFMHATFIMSQSNSEKY